MLNGTGCSSARRCWILQAQTVKTTTCLPPLTSKVLFSELLPCSVGMQRKERSVCDNNYTIRKVGM